MDDYLALVADLHKQISNMQAGFSAYALTVKHHTFELNRQQKRIEELEESNIKKDTAISELEEDKAKMATTIEKLEGARVGMAASIEELDKRMNEKEQNDEEEKVSQKVTPECERAKAKASREQLNRGQKRRLDEDLYYTAELGHTTEVQVSLANGAEVDSQHKNQYTALLIAADNGHLGVVNVLLSWGAEVDIPNSSHRTALMMASRNGHVLIVEALIAKGANTNARALHGWTSLMFAAIYNRTATVEALIRLGATVDSKNNDKQSALFLARRKGFSDIVKLLENAGPKE